MKETKTFAETFEGEMDTAWQWLRESPDDWSVDDGQLRIRTLPGSLWGDSNNARNLLLRPAREMTEGLTCEVTVHNRPVLQGEQAGLIWYVSDATYVKLVKESLEGAVWIVMAREENDEPELVDRIPFGEETAQMRLSFRNGEMVGEVQSADGGAWEQIATCDPVPASSVQVGIFTHGGAANADRWATFTEFEVNAE